MQVEQPHHPPSSLREFARQYAMIVLSILTALALERGAVALHNASVARASRVRIEAEIAVTRGDLHVSLTQNEERLKAVRELLKALVKDLGQTPPDEKSIASLASQALSQINIDVPDYPRDAWETAIADQSASYLDNADMRHYSEIYTSERNALNFTVALTEGNILTQLSNASLDLMKGKVDGPALAQVLVHYALIMKIIDEQETQLVKIIDKPPPVAQTRITGLH